MRLSAIYGHRWQTLYPKGDALNIAMAEWAQGLAGLTGEDLSRGIKACQQGGEWPPSLPEFLHWCTGLETLPASIAKMKACDYSGLVAQSICRCIPGYARMETVSLVARVREVYPQAFAQAFDEYRGLVDPQPALEPPGPAKPHEKHQRAMPQYVREAQARANERTYDEFRGVASGKRLPPRKDPDSPVERLERRWAHWLDPEREHAA